MGREPFRDLVALVEKLRAEDGCPWDRAQDHRSLRPYLLEEAHEAIAAIDAADLTSLADELGDLLLQILLHAQIAAEEGAFSIDNVLTLLAEKLVRRHPHVFASAPREMAAIRHTWTALKEKEGRTEHPLPALLAARKLVERLEAPIEEIPAASDEEEEGRRILAAIAAAWRRGVDPELALKRAIAELEGARGKRER
jgi:uncharacterized protein YabN with tetrapyrrole methylase and pyrophosphatase domain